MSVAVLVAGFVVCLAFQAFVCNVLRKALAAAQAENKRLVAIITAPTAVAAHVAALDRPPRPERDDERPVPPVGG